MEKNLLLKVRTDKSSDPFKVLNKSIDEDHYINTGLLKYIG